MEISREGKNNFSDIPIQFYFLQLNYTNDCKWWVN
jgi:hypothetical protein